MANPWDSEGAGPEIIVISALEHYSYCPRQCALIHLEQIFDENVFTVRGRQAHERVDDGETGKSGDVRVERSVPLWSHRLGLVGKADAVEFHGATPYPVEYKVGRRRQWGHETLQLCAQALCLEEMLGESVPQGAIYYRASRRRREVEFDDQLRRQVENAVQEIRVMLGRSDLPPPVNDPRCRHCSLIESCMPDVVNGRQRMQLVRRRLFQPIEGDR